MGGLILWLRRVELNVLQNVFQSLRVNVSQHSVNLFLENVLEQFARGTAVVRLRSVRVEGCDRNVLHHALPSVVVGDDDGGQ